MGLYSTSVVEMKNIYNDWNVIDPNAWNHAYLIYAVASGSSRTWIDQAACTHA